jgi:hypothetical protein
VGLGGLLLIRWFGGGLFVRLGVGWMGESD